MGDGKISVSFACQRCLQPLILENSFEHMSVHELAELACKYDVCLDRLDRYFVFLNHVE